ncbi:hypothetical protein ACIBK9_47315 [Nonomuraea sp. NPDC050227]|uniref:hypothetical protein n=1 Tax=Nonomuraea sp. NPDC050227 TaxID=3364360 RepID=UPI0037BA39E6
MTPPTKEVVEQRGLIRRFRRWLLEPLAQPFTPGFIAVTAALGLPAMAFGFWFGQYAMETGNGRVLAIVLVFALAGLADLFRRLNRARRSR